MCDVCVQQTLQGELDLVAEAQEFANAQALLRAPPGTRTGAPATPDGKFVWGKRHGGELTPVFNFGMHTGMQGCTFVHGPRAAFVASCCRPQLPCTAFALCPQLSFQLP